MSVRRTLSLLALTGMLAACGRAAPDGGAAQDADTARAQQPTPAATDTSAARDSSAANTTRPANGVRPAQTGQRPATSAAEVGDTVSGTLAVTGSAAMVQVTLIPAGGSGPGVQLVGPLEGELRALSGATVHVRGDDAPGHPGRAMTVTSYEVREINGERPALGNLVARGDTLLLVSSADTTVLTGAVEPLRGMVGAKVWVTGPRLDGQLRVQSYGVIKPRS